MQGIAAPHFSEETVYPENPVGGGQRADDEPRLIAFALMVHAEAAHFVCGEEGGHRLFRLAPVGRSRAVLDSQIDVVAQAFVQFPGVAFAEGGDRFLKNVLRHERGRPGEEGGQQKDYPLFHIRKYYEPPQCCRLRWMTKIRI